MGSEVGGGFVVEETGGSLGLCYRTLAFCICHVLLILM